MSPRLRYVPGLLITVVLLGLAACNDDADITLPAGPTDSRAASAGGDGPTDTTDANTGANASPDNGGTSPPSQVGHVFTIVLENKGFDETFGPDSSAPFLAQTLTARGQLLTQYYGIGHLSLDNYVAMVSGQAPNPQTQADCQFYSDFLGNAALNVNGQVVGNGCVYPAGVRTVVDQIEQAGLTWKGYMEDMGNDPDRDGSLTCAHPRLNRRDNTQTAQIGDQYAARHNPFVYFHSIIDDPARCNAHDVPLSRLPNDLLRAQDTPNYVFITPNLCHDGHDRPCVNGEPGGLVSADDFLREWVPRIMASPAYQNDGLIVITFDEAEAEGGQADAGACCGERPGPNSPLPGITGPGGGRTGTVLISPLIEPGSVNDTPYNHYSLLRSIENIFSLEHLGFAAQNGLKAFGDDVFDAGGS